MLRSSQTRRASQIVSGLLLFFTAAPALADEETTPPPQPAPSETASRPTPAPWVSHTKLDVDVLGIYAFGNLDRRELNQAGAQPYKVDDLRLRGQGRLAGGGFGMGFVHDTGWRGGFNAAFFGLSGLGLTHGPLPRDLSLSPATQWAATMDVFFGHQLDLRRFDLPWLVPYLDVRLGFGAIKGDVDARSSGGKPQTMERNAYMPLFGLRLGAKLRLTDAIAVDLSGSPTPYGPALLSLHAGMTFSLHGL